MEKISDNYFKIYSKKEKIYIDNSGNIVNNTDVFENLKLYSFKTEDNKWGYKDKDGNIIIEPSYDMVTELNEYGFAGIYKNSRWGVINSEGEILVQPSYELDTYYEPQFIGKYLLEGGDLPYCSEIKEK